MTVEDTEGKAEPQGKPMTVRYTYVARGGMELPQPSSGGSKAPIVRFVLGDLKTSTLKAVIARAKGAPAFSEHRANRPTLS